MEYITLPNLQNTYPNIDSYETENVNLFSLNGIYLQNEIDFILSDIKVITPVENTFFRFILVLRNNRQDNDVLGIYTSIPYYNDLLESYDESNPYFINASLKDEFLINVYVDDYLRIYTAQTQLEKQIGVKVELNTFYDIDGIPDYIKLVKYIDWIVTAPTLEDVDTDGVIPLTAISKFQLGKYNYDTNEWGTLTDVDVTLLKRDIEDELTALSIDIDEIQNYLKNPDSVKFAPDGAILRIIGGAGGLLLRAAAPKLLAGIFAKLAIGAALGPVGLIGVGVTTIIRGVISFFKAKKRQEQEEAELEIYVNKLKIELIRLKQRSAFLSTRLSELE